MNWTYNDVDVLELPDKCIGFVYKITNLENKKIYIGKKYSIQKRKDFKTKKRISKESNWRDYLGSCKDLTSDIKSLGMDNFKKQIIRFCFCKNELNYYEAKMQFQDDIMLDGKLCYNKFIGCKIKRFVLNK
jgi:hypothetical protein